MFKKIYIWILILASVKLLFAFFVRQIGIDPRRDIATKEKLCNSYRPNTVFVGTSRTLYGVNPSLFDSLNEQKTRTYNLGLFSLSSANAYAITRRLIEEKNDVKNIFVELSALNHNTILLRPGNLVNEVSFRYQALADVHHLDWHEKVSDFLTGANATVFQMFSIGPETDALKKWSNLVSGKMGRRASLDLQGHQAEDSRILKLNEAIQIYHSSTKSMMGISNPKKPNNFYISQINALIKAGEERGKKVIFFFPNNLSMAEVRVLAGVAPFVRRQNLIRLPSDERFDQLFLVGSLFDNYHLNVNGSRIFTTFLSQESTMLRK